MKVDTNSLGDELKLYKKKLEQLQKNLFDSQVENSTLHSQSTSFLSQINKLQTTQILLEASKKKFEEMEKVQLAEKDELLCDQVRKYSIIWVVRGPISEAGCFCEQNSTTISSTD